MLLFEVVPLIIQKPPSDLSANLVHRILTLGLEFYTSQIFLFNIGSVVPAEFSDTANLTTPICWSRIFEIVDVCSRILKWEPFLPYHQNWSKDVYWQKLYHIVSLSSTRPTENKQILFYGTILFVVSLHDYINSMKVKTDDTETRYILIETLTGNRHSIHTNKKNYWIRVLNHCVWLICFRFRGKWWSHKITSRIPWAAEHHHKSAVRCRSGHFIPYSRSMLAIAAIERNSANRFQTVAAIAAMFTVRKSIFGGSGLLFGPTGRSANTFK